MTPDGIPPSNFKHVLFCFTRLRHTVTVNTTDSPLSYTFGHSYIIDLVQGYDRLESEFSIRDTQRSISYQDAHEF